MASPARVLAAATTTGVALGAVLLTTTAGAAAPTTTPGASAAPPARVYVSLPRQGKAAPSAALIARGLRAATKARDGQAGGRRIKLVWLDDATGDRWDASKVVANAQAAAADPTAIAYVGEGNSEATALAMPIVNRAGLAHLSPVSSATSLTADDRAAELQPTGTRTFFRPVPDDGRQGSALVSYAKGSGVTGGVLLVDDDGLYGRGLTSAFATDAAKSGVRTIGRRVVAPDGGGLAALTREVRTLKPRAVVYGGSPSSGAADVVRGLHAASPKTLIFGGDALANAPFAESIGAAQSVMRLTTPAAHADPRNPKTHGLGRRPAAFSVFAHNGMTALLRAVDRSARTGAVTRESVRTAVFDGSLQTGLSGAWQLTASGDSNYGVFDALRLKGGRVQTPGELAVERLVRRQSAAFRARLQRKMRLGRTGPAPTTVQASVGLGGLSTATIQSMDLEAVLMLLAAERSKLLDSQLNEAIAALNASHAQVAKLNTVIARLRETIALYPAYAPADQALYTLWPSSSVVATLSTALTDANVKTLDVSKLLLVTLDALRGAVDHTKALIEAQSNSAQMDMLRLQSLSNKRNEAFDVLTNYVKKMQDARSSIIGNMR